MDVAAKKRVRDTTRKADKGYHRPSMERAGRTAGFSKDMIGAPAIFVVLLRALKPSRRLLHRKRVVTSSGIARRGPSCGVKRGG
nr:hypothetical protein CFP56_04191 [Quercus suber]